MKLRILVWVGVLTMMVVCGSVVGAGFAVLKSPSLLSRFPNASGADVGNASLAMAHNPADGRFSHRIENLGARAMTIAASSLTPKNALGAILRGEVDSLVLENLKLAFRVGPETTEASDLSFLGQLPNIRMLEVRNAEILVTFEGRPQRVRLTGVNATVRDYSPKTGGAIAFHADFDVAGGGEAGLVATGRIQGNAQLTGIPPEASGTGTMECAVDSARYGAGAQDVSLGRLTLVTEFDYDRATETLTVASVRGDSENLGVIRGAARAVMRQDMPWSATLSATSIDLARVFAVLQPFLPEEYRNWTKQGQGTVETQARGAMDHGRPSFDGTATVSITQGGFSSPDSMRAAQGVTGALSAHVTYVAPEQKLAFSVQAEQREGEYLWGTYYNNLAGRRASLTTEGGLFFSGRRRFELKGALDLFQTGDYSFSAAGQGDDWTGHFKAAEVSHGRIIDTLLREYLKGMSPGLASLAVTGTSSLEATVRHEGGAVAIAGRYRTNGAKLDAPDVPLSVRQMAADVPFALRYPASAASTASVPLPGFIRFESIQRERLTVDSLQVPLIIAQNRLEVPEPITVPFFGGQVHLYGLQVDDVLFPTRYRFGVRITDVDLGRMTRRLTGVEYPGTVNADLGMMRYEKGRIASEGSAVVTVFGGEIEATDLFAENVASASRKVGGDITFKDLSLEELTRKIAIGRMSGVIQGSLKDLVVEFGEPASFTLALESVEKRGVAQWISMDAIQSISILGTGAGSALNRGITQFFKEYPYSKIGFRCTLRNDQFSVNGTIHEGGKEYLVRRGLLRGVDVINQNPNNVISFRDMAERVQRIFRTSHIEPGGIKVE